MFTEIPAAPRKILTIQFIMFFFSQLMFKSMKVVS